MTYCVLKTPTWLGGMSRISEKIWDGEVFISGSKTNARGIAVLFGSNFEYKVHNIDKDIDGNLLEIDLTTNNINIKIMVIYAPNTDDPLFFNDIYIKD